MSEIWTTDVLASWCDSLEPAELPDAVIAKAEDCILDGIACAMSGLVSSATHAVGTMARETYRNGPAPIWFSSDALTPIGAAFINATAASILDIDDGHRMALGHPGAAVVPAALAKASSVECTGLELLTAVIAGYETAVRIGASEKRKAYHTGNFSSFGAATTTALLGKMAPEHHAQALSITAYHGPHIADLTLSSDMGNSVKESIPWSVVAGMSAAELAGQGFTGCRDALDIDERFLPGVACEGLGQGFVILGTYFKRYSACRWIHSAMEMLSKLMAEHNLIADDISSIHVETFDQAANLDNLTDPPTPESAQYSVTYCLGLIATLGEQALMPLRDSSLHHGPAVTFAKRVRVEATPEMNAKFPARAAARVTVETESGRFDAETQSPWGEPDSGIGRADLVEKFHLLADGVMPGAHVDAIITAVEYLKTGGVGPLIKLLGTPMGELSVKRRVLANG